MKVTETTPERNFRLELTGNEVSRLGMFLDTLVGRPVFVGEDRQFLYDLRSALKEAFSK